MAPQHDEILKRLDDGLVVAWDTTRVDRAKLKEARTVGLEQAAALGRIIGAAARDVKPAQPRDRARRRVSG
jgi:hypothetical protein